MSTTIVSETLVVTAASAAAVATETQMVTTKLATAVASIEVEFVKCDCCGLTEECTLGYIETIRERYKGKWVCGLCAEAVKDEMAKRSDERMISTEEAMTKHFNFCRKFRSQGPPSDAAIHLISALRQILRRSFDSPRSLKSMPCSPRTSERCEVDSGVLVRSGSCVPSLSVVGAVEEEEDKEN